MAAVWYYAQDQKIVGPIHEASLKELASSGRLIPTDLVWTHGMLTWECAASIHGLFAAVSGPPPLPVSRVFPGSEEPTPSDSCPVGSADATGIPLESDSDANDELFGDDDDQQISAAKACLESYDYGSYICDIDTLENEEAAELLSRCQGFLRLDHVVRISPGAAMILGDSRSLQGIALDSLETLSEDVARNLGSFSGELSLKSLKSLDATVAHFLCPTFAPRNLSGIIDLSPEVAARLVADAQYQGGGGRLWLDGLQVISLELAAALMGEKNADSPVWWESLSLNGVQTLSPDVARMITWQAEDDQGGCSRLSLNGLNNLSADLASAFSGFDGALSLNGIRELSTSSAEALAQQVGELSLTGLKILSDGAAKALACHDGRIILSEATIVSGKAVTLIDQLVTWAVVSAKGQ